MQFLFCIILARRLLALPLGELSPKVTERGKASFFLHIKYFVRSIHLIRFALRTTFPSRGRLFRIYNRSKTKPGKTELRFIHIFFYAA